MLAQNMCSRLLFDFETIWFGSIALVLGRNFQLCLQTETRNLQGMYFEKSHLYHTKVLRWKGYTKRNNKNNFSNKKWSTIVAGSLEFRSYLKIFERILFINMSYISLSYKPIVSINMLNVSDGDDSLISQQIHVV